MNCQGYSLNRDRDRVELIHPIAHPNPLALNPHLWPTPESLTRATGSKTYYYIIQSQEMN